MLRRLCSRQTLAAVLPSRPRQHHQRLRQLQQRP
jgi:hypothetical protein